MHRYFTTLLIALVMAISLEATTVVNFNIADPAYNLPGIYMDINTPSFDDSIIKRWDLSTSAPLYSGSNLYGGLNVELFNYSAPNNFSFSRYHDNDPTGWPNVPMVFLQLQDAQPPSYHNFNWVVFIQKSDFLGVSGTDLVQFDASSALQADIRTWWGNAGLNPSLHFLVREGAQYFMSEYAVDPNYGGGSAMALTDFNNNPTVGRRWVPVDLTATSFAIPTDPVYGPVGFTDVTAIGLITQGSRSYGGTCAFTTLMAEAVVSAPPANTFATWLTTNNLTGPAAEFHADPDNDRIPNALEYAFGLSPNAAPNAANAAPFVVGLGSVAPQAGDGLSHLTLVYNRPVAPPGDVSFKVQVSNDLSAWYDIVEAPGSGDRQATVTPGTPANGLWPVTVQLNDPSSSVLTYQFMRAVTVIAP